VEYNLKDMDRGKVEFKEEVFKLNPWIDLVKGCIPAEIEPYKDKAWIPEFVIPRVWVNKDKIQGILESGMLTTSRNNGIFAILKTFGGALKNVR
jgi:hypothetical protein